MYYFIAPEIKNNIDIDKSKVDLWSIGIIIHELYFGETPKNNIIQKTNNIYLDDLIKKLLIEQPFDENNKYLYKLSDYGLSKQLTENHKASTNIGTIDYIAPEIKNNLNIDKSKVDLWSIGILIHKLYFGNTPKNNIIQKTNNIYLDDLIKKLLIEKPFDENENNCRISWEDYFNHNFFKNNYIKEIENLKKSLEKFNNTIKDMINFISNKSNEFNNLNKRRN